MTIDVTGITWRDPALAWKKGGEAIFVIRYENHSETAGVAYPGIRITSSDPRALADSGATIVEPDLYALSPCMVHESRDHHFALLADLPSGAPLTFTLAPAVATGEDIGTCGDTLSTTTFGVTVP